MLCTQSSERLPGTYLHSLHNVHDIVKGLLEKYGLSGSRLYIRFSDKCLQKSNIYNFLISDLHVLPSESTVA